MRTESYSADIYVGFKNRVTGKTVSRRKAKKVVAEFVNMLPDGAPAGCVSVKDTEYIYKGGAERGLCVTLINYPRFPSRKGALREDAFHLAEKLMYELKQCRVSVVYPDFTEMLSNPSQIERIK